MSGYRVKCAAVLLGALVFGGCEKSETTMPPPVIEVGVIQLKPVSIALEQELSGRAKAPKVAEIRPEVSGIINKVVFKEGQRVKKGDILYEIKPDVYKSAYDGAAAALESAKANFESLKIKKSRYDELIKFEGISKQEYDDMNATFLQAGANVKEREAALEKARLDLEKTSIVAPISGIIGISSVTEGALVTALQASALTTVRAIDTMFVDLSQSSNQLLNLRKMMSEKNIKQGSAEVRLKLLDDSYYPHKGILKLQEIAVDESTSTVTLRAEFPNPEGELLPGMYVRAVIEEAVNTDSFLVPQQAVLRDSRGNPVVTVVTASNGTKTKIITADRALGNKWVVTDGVEAGDRLVIEGLNRINSRSKVTTVDVSSKYLNSTASGQ